MAINLWKLGSMPTSYTLYTGYGNKVTLPIGEYVISFKAKSVTGTTLSIQAQDGATFKVDGVSVKNFALTNEYVTYRFNIVVTKAQIMYLYDISSSANIQISDIKLVQKPLPKFTINGIDGFLSGKWTLHANAKVIDDETLELNATGDTQNNVLNIKGVQGNTSYTVNVEHDGEVRIDATSDTTGLGAVVFNSQNKLNSFTTPVGTTQLNITLRNKTGQRGLVRFKRPMLNLGTTPAPYSKKTGEKMVLPVAKGNLFNFKAYSSPTNTQIDNGYRVSGAYSSTIGNGLTLNLKPNTTYTMSGIIKVVSGTGVGAIGRITLNNGSGFLHLLLGSAIGYQQWTFTTPNDISNYNNLIVYGSSTVTDVIEITNIQLNEGTTPQPYTPYAVQVNPKPKKWVAKKNLFDGQFDNGYLNSSGGFVSGSPYRSTKWIKCSPNKTYVLSGGDRNTWHIRNASGSITSLVSQQSITTLSDTVELRVYYSTDGTHTNVQIEEGTTATQYEPYKQILPRAKSGLSFNGVTDYLQLPSMTMDSIEIDCLIEPSSATQYLFDARSGLAGNGMVTVTSGGILSVGSALSLSGGSFSTNQRSKVRISSGVAFTDDVTFFARTSTFTEKAKGTLYKVTCYLNNQVVATYDFENPSNIVGDKVLASVVGNVGKNLFDGYSEIGTIAGTTGADGVNATRKRSGYISVKPNTTYTLSNDGAFDLYLNEYDNNKTGVGGTVKATLNTGAKSVTFTTSNNVYFVRFRNGDNQAFAPIQLEEGTQATPFEPFSLVPVKSKPNLIPSFEDTRWSLHANFKVLGKDVGRLDASAANSPSEVILDVKPNVSYLLTCQFGSSQLPHRARILDDSTGNILSSVLPTVNPITYTPTVSKIRIRLDNNGSNAGTFDFIQPKLYELTGKEAQVIGKPTAQKKAVKRTLYNKR